MDGVRHCTRAGCPWRDVPERYGPWWRVYDLFATWQILGVRERIESALLAAADAAGKLSWQVSVDSITSHAHVHAARARRGFATLYGKLAIQFEASTHIAVIDHWLRRLS